MQGFPFFEKKMRIQFSRTESDIITKRAGTYMPREKRRLPQPQAGDGSAANHAKLNSGAMPGVVPMIPVGAVAPPPVLPVPPPVAPGPPIGDVPHNILYATGLPAEITQVMLKKLFEHYTGFTEVRMAPGGQAFIEFADQMQAGIALSALNGFKLTDTNPLQLAFARKA